VKPEEVADMNSKWGMRMNSNTDFKPYHALETIQGVNDMAVVKLAAHIYQKEPDFVLGFGDTGIKINMSLFGRGDGKGGIIFDAVEGMDPKFAKWAHGRYKDAGGMLLGTDEEAIIAGMRPENNWIGQIIPHHGANQPKSFMEAMKWKNWKDAHEKPLLRSELLPGQEPSEFNGYIERNLHKDNVDLFMKIVEENRLRPRHAEFIYNLDKKGRIQRYEDGSIQRRWTGPAGEKNTAALMKKAGVKGWNDPKAVRAYGKKMEQGYMKLVVDYARTDTPLRPVKPNYNLDHIEKMFKDWQKEGVKAGTEGQAENASMDLVNAYIELRSQGKLPDPRVFSGKDNLPLKKPSRVKSTMKKESGSRPKVTGGDKGGRVTADPRTIKNKLVRRAMDPSSEAYSSGSDTFAAIMEMDAGDLAYEFNLNTLKDSTVAAARKELMRLTQESLEKKFPGEDTVKLYRGGPVKAKGLVSLTTDRNVAKSHAKRKGGEVYEYTVPKEKVVLDSDYLNVQKTSFEEYEMLVHAKDLEAQ
jgi:hypothetical protein